MVTNSPGKSARLFATQQSHYIVRGGPNDPVLPATGGPPVTTGGMFSYNSVLTVPPVPGAQPATPQSQTINSTTGATTAATITTNNGGIYIGTLPAGAWITMIQVYVYTTFSGGTNDTIALAAAIADTPYPVATLQNLVTMTAFTGGVLYGAPSGTGATAFATAVGLGPGSGAASAAGRTATQDMDLYLVTYLAAGTGTAFTAGSASIMIEFTGLEG